MRCLFGLSVWGQPYIDNFLKLALPMHMAPGNLENLPDIDRCLYLINTREEDVGYLKSRPEIQALQSIMPVEFRLIRIRTGQKYEHLGLLQTEILRYASKHKFEIVFMLYSDLLYSTGTFHNSIKRLSEGYQSVLSLGPQAVAGPLTEELLSGRFVHGSHALAVPPRALVDIVFRHLHPFRAPSFWDFGKFTNTPSLIFWNVPGQGVLAHAYHLHPVALAVMKSPVFTSPFYGTLDENFMPLLFDCADTIHIVSDSDEMFMCSMDDIQLEDRVENTTGNPSIARAARWAERHSFLLHREMAHTALRLHSGDLDLEKWRPYEEKAQRIIMRVSQRLGMSDATLKSEDPQAYIGRRYHRDILKKMFYAFELDHAQYASLLLYFNWRFLSFMRSNIPFFTELERRADLILTVVSVRIITLLTHFVPALRSRSLHLAESSRVGPLRKLRMVLRKRYYDDEVLRRLPPRTILRELKRRVFFVRQFKSLLRVK